MQQTNSEEKGDFRICSNCGSIKSSRGKDSSSSQKEREKGGREREVHPSSPFAEKKDLRFLFDNFR